MKNKRQKVVLGMLVAALLGVRQAAFVATREAEPKGALYREYLLFLGSLQNRVSDQTSAASQALSQLDQDATVERIRDVVNRSLAMVEGTHAQTHAPSSSHARILERAHELLQETVFEIGRLAREAQDVRKYREAIAGLLGRVQSWADTPAEVRIQMVQTSKNAQPSGILGVQKFPLPPTEDNIEGPFYRPNAPFTTRLAGPRDSGGALVISGKVLGRDGTHIAGALVDVWQADSQGEYDISHPDDRTNPRILYRFRGRMHTDINGGFQFETVMPAAYAIGEGRFRPKHIHYKISAPTFKALTTQMYFEGDIYNAVDPWWRPSLSIPLETTNGYKRGTFDIVLSPQAPQ